MQNLLKRTVLGKDPDNLKFGGASAWITGSYDPALNIVYWGTGNPNPDWDGVGQIDTFAPIATRGDVVDTAGEFES